MIPLPLPLPPLPALPALPAAREKIEVTKIGHNKMEVRAGGCVEVIDRGEAFRLLGMLERTAALL